MGLVGVLMEISKVELPKACISCQAFRVKGFAEDKYSPFVARFNKPEPKTQYGRCESSGNDVFVTEICERYQQEPNTIVFVVKNRPNGY